MKTLSIIFLTALLMLTGCENPLKKSGKKPSNNELKATVFKDMLPFVVIKKFDYEFVDNPENAKANKYEVYIETEFQYKEALYEGYHIDESPLVYQRKGLNDLAILCQENLLLKSRGDKGLSPVLLKVCDVGINLNSKLLIEVIKMEKAWKTIAVKSNEGSAKARNGNLKYFFSDKYLVWGSPEHLAELNHYGIKLPGKNL